MGSSFTTFSKPSAREAAVQARRLPGSNELELRGVVPIGSAPMTRTLSVDNPTLFFVTVLRNTLIAHGIDVDGPAVDIDEVKDAPPRAGAEGCCRIDRRRWRRSRRR